VVSFGNVSASGGYYISANAERIFASPTTITGSIGVVMLRMDFRALAKQYGVTFDSIPTSSLSGSFDPFFPMNQQMNENFANAADRAYYRFKSLVSDGRGIDMKTVETIAQGRVFTGEQASQIGLVDELGGLHRAIAYAQRNFTSSGHAQVIQWPPKKSLLDFLMGDEQDDFEDLELPSALFDIAASYLSEGDVRLSWIRNRLCLDAPPTVNANNDITNLEHDLPFPLVTSGIMLAADENTAIQQLLEANNIPQAKILSNLSHGLWE
jgi:ClpP class serine protease